MGDRFNEGLACEAIVRRLESRDQRSMQACVFPKRSNGNEKTRNRSRLPGREFDIGLSLNRKRGSAKHGLAADRKGCLQLIMDGLRRIAK